MIIENETEYIKTYFSNQSVRFVVWRIIFNKFGEFISLSSLVHTLPTSSEGWTFLRNQKSTQFNLQGLLSKLFKGLLAVNKKNTIKPKDKWKNIEEVIHQGREPDIKNKQKTLSLTQGKEY